jgi:hypothetical protein
MSARPCPGKLAASRVATLPLSQMAPCVVRLGSPCVSTSSAEKPMGDCAWSMQPAFATAAPAKLAGAVSMAGPRHRQAPPGERAVTSPRRRGCSSAASRDWSRRFHRRACLHLLRDQRLEMQVESGSSVSPILSPALLSRAQRAHYRLSWQERFARNARAPTASRVMIKLFGVPEGFATSLGLATA